MKVITKKLLFSIMIATLLLTIGIFYPNTAGATEDLVITKWIVDATLQDTGDLLIAEHITFQFNTDFNGVFREIGLAGTSGISDLQIYEIENGLDHKYTLDTEASKGDSQVYLTVDDSDYKKVQIFSPSEDEEKTFRLSYIVKDVGTRYSDTGELYYKFLGNENSTPIDLFIVNMILPESSLGGQVRVFAHGPQNGEIIVDNAPIYTLRVEDVPTNTFVEGRFLFPTELIHNATKKEDVDKLDDIIAQEEAYQQELEDARIRRERTAKTLGNISLWSSIIGLGLFILGLIQFRREKDKRQLDEYTGEQIPVECSPAVAARLLGSTSSNVVFATLLELQRRGYIAIEELAPPDENSQAEDFKISRLKDDEAGMLNHERKFMKWLFDDMGDGRSVKTNEIRELSKEKPTKYLTLYSSWSKAVKADADEMGYYDKSKLPFGCIALLLSASLFVLGIITLAYDNKIGLLSMFVSALPFIYGLTLISRLSDQGYMLYKKWKKFRSYMRNRLKESEDGEALAAYDISLIYALALGIVSTKEDIMPNEYATSSTRSNWIFWYFIYSSGNNNAFHKSIDNSFGSSGGSGGGFSGGGGGGAGGGGAGGF